MTDDKKQNSSNPKRLLDSPKTRIKNGLPKGTVGTEKRPDPSTPKKTKKDK